MERNTDKHDIAYILSLNILELFCIERSVKSNISCVELTPKTEDLCTILSQQLLSAKHTLKYYFNHWLVLDSSNVPEITKWNDLPDEIDAAL